VLAGLSVLDGPELIATPGVELTIGIDVAAESEATIIGLAPPYLEPPLVRSDAATIIGVRAADARITFDGCTISNYYGYGATQMFGVVLEDSDASMQASSIRLAPIIELGAAEPATSIGILATGSGSLEMDGTHVGVMTYSMRPIVGIDLNGIHASLHSSDVTVSDGGTGIHSRNARVTMTASSVRAQGEFARGVILENSPGSTVGGVTASGSNTSGVVVFGDATDTRIGSVAISGYGSGVGVSFSDCGGAAPLFEGTIAPPYGNPASLQATAISASGNCHPRVENSSISLKVSGWAPSYAAIGCGAASGCVLKNNTISIDYAHGSPVGAATVMGVKCEDCAEVSSLHVSLTESTPCGRSCYREGYGVVGGGGPITDISLEVHCVNSTKPQCWDISAPIGSLP
jgi:hypothetical protein